MHPPTNNELSILLCPAENNYPRQGQFLIPISNYSHDPLYLSLSK
jgi:hypothetical protein